MADLTERGAEAPEPVPEGSAVPDELAAARREELAGRPGNLRAAVAALQAALASGGGADADRRDRLVAALTEAHDHLAAHNAEAEGPDGLLAQVLQDAAWLSPRVHVVAQEHDRLLADCQQLCAAGHGDDPLDELERLAREMAERIDGHRHHGTELLMDAYGLDVSAGD
jgi:hypothetical protein